MTYSSEHIFEVDFEELELFIFGSLWIGISVPVSVSLNTVLFVYSHIPRFLYIVS